MSQNKGRSRVRAGAVRIVGGRWRRTVLEVVDSPGLRPTTDRVRETLFNWLTHAFGGDLEGRSVLDLFAGTGALGFEAASRGARRVVLVESNTLVSRHLERVRTRLAATEVAVQTGDALQSATRYRKNDERFDVIFVDPPFHGGWVDRILPLAVPLSAPGGFIYVETEVALSPSLLSLHELEIYRADKAGEVFYYLLQRKKNDC